jgi:amidase
MADLPIALWSLDRQLDALRAGQVSSVELLDACVAQIEAHNARVNAVVTLDLEPAYAAARASDDSRRAGAQMGALAGLPFTVKDAIETGGLRSTGGATALRDHVPTRDAPAVARLRGAGAILFGKTNLPSWSGDIQSSNDLFGTTNNPWDVTRTAGGSSGGAAAAVATGMTTFELGTDIGGSVRIPSSFCGVFGHKPSYGVIPQRGYLDHVGGGTIDADINVFGPIARAAADLQHLFGVLAGPTDDDAVGWRLELPPPRARELGELRIGTWLDDPQASVGPDVGTVLAGCVDQLVAAGAQVDTNHPDIDIAEAFPIYLRLVLAAASVGRPERRELAIEHSDWLAVTERRADLRQRWRAWFGTHDILLCPVMPMAAFPHDLDRSIAKRTVDINGSARRHIETTAWTGLIGVAYLPSTVVPVGRTSDGLPVGIQVVGAYLEDNTTLRAARMIADVLGPWTVPPGVGPVVGGSQ